MNLTLFGSRNHISVARFSSPCLRAWGPGVGSLSPPPCFFKQEGPGLSRASCRVLSNLLDRAVCCCCVFIPTVSEWSNLDCLLPYQFHLGPCWQVHPWGWESVWGLYIFSWLLRFAQFHPLRLKQTCTGEMEDKVPSCGSSGRTFSVVLLPHYIGDSLPLLSVKDC